MKFVLNEGITLELDLLRVTASVISSPDAKGDIIIPLNAVYSGKEFIITSISENAFLNNNLISSIQFVKNSQVLKICKNAFAYSSLQKLYIPKSLAILEEGWCLNAKKLNYIEVSPKSHYFNLIDYKLISKDGRTIFFVQKDIEKIDIPTTVKTISSYSFAHCYNLQLINFYKIDNLSTESKILPIYPANIMKVNSTAPFFDEIKGQDDYFKISEKKDTETEIEVSKVGESAFKPINDVMPFSYVSIAFAARIKIASAMKEKSKNKLSQTTNSNVNDNSTNNANDETKLDDNPSKSHGPVIPEIRLADTDIEELGDFAFAYCPSLITIRSIPSSVKKVGCYCFCDNINLETVEFLSKELIVGDYIFQGCGKLESVSFPNVQKLLLSSAAFNGLTNQIYLYILPGANIKII